MNLKDDYIGHEYKINLDHNHRFGVFVYQIIPDIYKDINTHNSKILALVFIKKTTERFMMMDVVLTPSMSSKLIDLTKLIICKHVYDEVVEFNYDNKTKLITGDKL